MDVQALPTDAFLDTPEAVGNDLNWSQAPVARYRSSSRPRTTGRRSRPRSLDEGTSTTTPAATYTDATAAATATAASATPGPSNRRKRSFGAVSASASLPNEQSPSPTPEGQLATTPTVNRRKNHKVSRACDLCKQRKAKCSGTLPCTKCARKGLVCLYDAKYSRGRPPTPPLYTDEQQQQQQQQQREEEREEERDQDEEKEQEQEQEQGQGQNQSQNRGQNQNHNQDHSHETAPSSINILETVSDPGPPYPTHNAEAVVAPPGPAPPPRARDTMNPSVSRASPELGVAEIQGQIFDPTSGVTFLHRAWKRLSKHHHNHHDGSVPPEHAANLAATEHQPWMLAGDRPLPQVTDDDAYGLTLPNPAELRHLLALYFDVCIATYRIVHRPSLEAWLGIMEANQKHGKPIWYDIGKARASMVLTALSIASAHFEKSKGLHSQEDEAQALARSDRLFCVASQLTETETGLPRLESAQTRIIQTLYLLTTSRMNRAWYNFGNALQIISALGLHRKAAKNRHLTSRHVDYVHVQCRIRTFWTAYVLDKYLGVIFGRPRHYHDDDIDQDLPDRVDDEDMTAQGPIKSAEDQGNSHIDALIFHSKIAQIIGNTSRDVYSIKPISEKERVDAAHRLSKQLHEWRESLPPHLGSVPPSMLVTSFRRQSIVLNLAYCHAIMHANRLFLLGNLGAGQSEAQILECVGAARAVLEVVDGLAAEGPIFHAFWWTQYVTFCALVVCYVWDIQRMRRGIELEEEARHGRLMELAERGQTHLAKATASNSPSRRYAVILEEFRSEAMGLKAFQNNGGAHHAQQVSVNAGATMHHPPAPPLAHPHPHPHPAASAAAHVQVGGGGGGGQDGVVAGGYAPDAAAMQTTESDARYVDMMGQADSAGFGSSLLDEWQMTDWLDLDSSAFGPYLDVDVDMTSLNWMSDVAGLGATDTS